MESTLSRIKLKDESEVSDAHERILLDRVAIPMLVQSQMQ